MNKGLTLAEITQTVADFLVFLQYVFLGVPHVPQRMNIRSSQEPDHPTDDEGAAQTWLALLQTSQAGRIMLSCQQRIQQSSDDHPKKNADGSCLASHHPLRFCVTNPQRAWKRCSPCRFHLSSLGHCHRCRCLSYPVHFP